MKPLAHIFGILVLVSLLLVSGCTKAQEEGGPLSSGNDFTPPNPPQNLSAANDDGTLFISWDANTEADLAGYNLYYGKINDGFDTQIVLEPIIQYELVGLENNVEYQFIIQAFDTHNNLGNVSEKETAIPFDTHPPAVPSNIVLSAITNDPTHARPYYFELNWSNPSDRDFQGIAIVRKQDSPPSGPNDPAATTVFDGTGETFRDDTVEKNKLYYYQVYAYDYIPNYSLNTPSDTRSGILPTN